jgi:tetratricopeptide (TPR) repeat protein
MYDRRMLRIVCVTLGVLASTAGADEVPIIPVDEKLEAAKAAFKEGVALYDRGEYEPALREFQRAHALSHNAVLYFNMAACEEKSDHFQAAALLLRQYILEQPNAEDREAVQARINVLEHREEGVKRPPHMHDEPTTRPVVVNIPLPPPPKRVVSWALLGLTGALFITTVGIGAATVVDHDSLKSGCGATPAGCSDAQISSMHNKAIATDALIGVTAAAAVATVIVFIVEPRTRRAQAWLGPNGVRF